MKTDKKYRNILIIGLIVITVAGIFLATRCRHEWEEATCTHPKECILCGKTEGEILPHTWKEATCTTPKTCRICGKTEGELMPHKWQKATCAHPKQCRVCKLSEGEPLPHTWEEANCTTPKNCTVCGKVEGEPLGHDYIPATCITPEQCTRCGKKNGLKTKGSDNHSLDARGTCTLCGNNYGLRLSEDNYKKYFNIYFQNAHSIEGKMHLSDDREYDVYLIVEAKSPSLGSNQTVSFDNLTLNADFTVIRSGRFSSGNTYHVSMGLGEAKEGKKLGKKISLEPGDYYHFYEDVDFELKPSFTGYGIVKTGDKLTRVEYN